MLNTLIGLFTFKGGVSEGSIVRDRIRQKVFFELLLAISDFMICLLFCIVKHFATLALKCSINKDYYYYYYYYYYYVVAG